MRKWAWLNNTKTNDVTSKMAGFSGALQLTDLDDFITPSQVYKQSRMYEVITHADI